MITSEQISLLYELRQIPIPEATLFELEARLQHRIHSMILEVFNKSNLSQKELAGRLGWDTARVSRCLGTSSNWTLKTISALLAAMGVDLDEPSYTSFDDLERQLGAHGSPTIAEPPPENQHGTGSLAMRQLELALEANQPSGITQTSIAAIPAGTINAFPETMRQETQGGKIAYMKDYRSNASGQVQDALSKGIANAG